MRWSSALRQTRSQKTGCSIIILSTLRDSKNDNAVRKLLAIGIVAAGYGGDCKEEICNELLDDIDFHFNRVKCRKIESLLPLLNDYESDEIQQMR